MTLEHAQLEKFILQLNLYHESISNLTCKLCEPIIIDDRGLRLTINDIIKGMEELNLPQIMGEIKYIGKRLLHIEKILEKLDKNVLTKKVNLEFSVDGYELVKRNKINNPEIPDNSDEIPDNSDKEIIEILSTLSKRESICIIHRLGLLGEKSKTFVKTGEILNCGREGARRIESNALRKLRHPSRIEKVRKCSNDKLRKEVCGDI
jgi:DNA-directed RNA polymerase specialized sigma subunit